MTFGMCGGLDVAADIKKAGFDFFEWKLKELTSISESEFNDACAFIKNTDIVPESFNSFFPDDFRLTGDVDYAKIKEYVDLALERAKRLGGEIAVLGCGKTRRVPPGFSKQRALSQFMQVAKICGDAALKHDLKIAIEPLNTGETDLINTLQEGIEFCNALDHSNVGLIIDFFHVFKNNENIETVKNTGKHLFHVHLARPNADRGAPKAEDRDICAKWADILKQSGYNGRISLEIRKSADLSSDLESLALLKEIF